MKYLMLLLLATLLPLVIPAQEVDAEPEKGVVTGDRLNVRAQPGTRYEVLTQLRQNETVVILKRQLPWIGIQAPRAADAWLPAEALDDDGAVTKELAEIHAGPGIYYTTYGTLKKGQKVEVKRIKDELWVEIVPPEGVIAWVHRDYVRTPRSDAEAEAAVEPPPEPPPVQAETPDGPAGVAGTVEKIDPPSEGATAESVGLPHAIERVGYVVPLGSEQGPWTFALAQKVDDVYYPIAYLDKNYPKLAEWEWRHVVVSGKQHWLDGWPRPRIQIESLKLVVTQEADGTAPPADPVPAN